MERKFVNGLPVYTVSIDENDDLGIDMIAFTSNPAIQVKGLAFSSDKKFFFSDNVKMRVTAPAMIPKTIYRNDDGEEYYVEFTADVIEKLHARFMKQIAAGEAPIAFNKEHNTAATVPAYILEAWIVEDPKTDKSYSKFGIAVPSGTLMITAQITDEKYYNEIVAKEMLGFSIEGMFGLYSETKKIENQMEEIKLPDGEHKIGDKIYVVKDGVIVEVKEEIVAEAECGCGGKPVELEEVKEEEEIIAEEVKEEEVKMQVDEALIEAIVEAKLADVYEMIAELKAELLAAKPAEAPVEEPVALTAHQKFAEVQRHYLKKK